MENDFLGYLLPCWCGCGCGEKEVKVTALLGSALLVTPGGLSRYLKHVPLRLSLVRHAGSVTNNIIHEQFNILN